MLFLRIGVYGNKNDKIMIKIQEVWWNFSTIFLKLVIFVLISYFVVVVVVERFAAPNLLLFCFSSFFLFLRVFCFFFFSCLCERENKEDDDDKYDAETTRIRNGVDGKTHWLRIDY